MFDFCACFALLTVFSVALSVPVTEAEPDLACEHGSKPQQSIGPVADAFASGEKVASNVSPYLDVKEEKIMDTAAGNESPSASIQAADWKQANEQIREMIANPRVTDEGSETESDTVT